MLVHRGYGPRLLRLDEAISSDDHTLMGPIGGHFVPFRNPVLEQNPASLDGRNLSPSRHRGTTACRLYVMDFGVHAY